MYLNHTTITTGHIFRAERGAADAGRLSLVAGWLAAALESGGKPTPLPNLGGLHATAAPPGYDAVAVTGHGGLVCTISPQGERTPLVTFGVAKKSRGSGGLWRMLIDAAAKTTPTPNWLASIAPSTPYCAAIVWPASVLHPQLIAAAAEFEQLVAWAWIERKGFA